MPCITFFVKCEKLWYIAGMSSVVLLKEVERLRSFAVSIVGRDAEGEYRTPFVQKILGAAHQRPTRHFEGSEKFLTALESSHDA